MSDIDENGDLLANESDLNDVFTRAADSLKGIAGSLSEEKLLKLYGFYKQAVDGPCNTSKPGFWDFKGCKKWNAWKNLGDLSKEESMQKYIELVREVNPDFEITKPKSWISVSCMQNNTQDVPESDKSVFDFCKDSNLEKLKLLLKVADIDKPDGEGMCLVHWAADRGASDILAFLAENGANLNVQDADGQTALHYAASCENLNCVMVLLKYGADKSIKDDDGLNPADVAPEGIKSALM